MPPHVTGQAHVHGVALRLGPVEKPLPRNRLDEGLCAICAHARAGTARSRSSAKCRGPEPHAGQSGHRGRHVEVTACGEGRNSLTHCTSARLSATWVCI